MAASDKKLACSLEKQWVGVGSPPTPAVVFGDDDHGRSASISPGAVLSSSAGAAGTSPLGSVVDSSTRKLLINLILTLNNSFADYDFRNLRPEDFVREASLEMVMNSVNSKLSRVDEAEHGDLCGRLWSALDTEASLRECEIFSYVADMDEDALSLGKIWSVNYFFYNKKLKKIAFFACWIKSKSHSRSFENSDHEGMGSDEDGMDFDDME